MYPPLKKVPHVLSQIQVWRIWWPSWNLNILPIQISCDCMLMVIGVIIINENENLACTNSIESNHSVQDIINVPKTIHGNPASPMELGTHMHTDASPDHEATTTPMVVWYNVLAFVTICKLTADCDHAIIVA